MSYQQTAFRTITSLIQEPLEDEIVDDLIAEQQTLEGQPDDADDGATDDGATDGGTDGTDNLDSSPLQSEEEEQTPLANIGEYQNLILAASKAVAERTAREYQTQMRKFNEFLIERKFVTSGQAVFTPEPHKDTPWWICYWILETCDVIDVNNKPVSPDDAKTRPTYAHAQKMCAAMSYAFGRMQRIGYIPWQEPPSASGRPTGNPSVSEIVSSYMVSLRRRKVQAGETSVSSRAITEGILREMYDFNNDQGRSTLGGYPPAGSWCGPLTRLMIQAACTIAFACLLRFDEALRIQVSDLEFLKDKQGNLTIVKLMLRSRKTSQFGGKCIKPFFLHLLPDHEAHLCPVRALFTWIHASRITTGFLFRPTTKFGLVSRTNKAMSTTAFLKLFRMNLIDVKVDPAPYGTHSIRRGGVQYLLLFKRAGLRQICEWGGWSTEFTSASVLRHIISVSDNVQLIRQDFLDPNRPPQLKCYACGRMCHCSS